MTVTVEELRGLANTTSLDLEKFNNAAIGVVTGLTAEVDNLTRLLHQPLAFKYGCAMVDNGDPTELEKRIINTVLGTRKYRTGNEADVVKVLSQIKADGQAGRKYTFVSFKADDNWFNMASGKQDTFLNSMRDRIQNTADQFNITAYLSFNHEPENDKGISDAMAKNWTDMQSHLGDIFVTNNIRYGVILMGYHSMPSIMATEGERWKLENCVPNNAKFVLFDYYEKHGRSKVKDNKPTGVEETDRTDYETVFKVLRDFCKPRDMEYGLGEVAICARGFKTYPDWYDHMFYMGLYYGVSILLQFNTSQNDSQPGPDTGWLMEPNGPREKAFGVTLGKAHEYNGR